MNASNTNTIAFPLPSSLTSSVTANGEADGLVASPTNGSPTATTTTTMVLRSESESEVKLGGNSKEEEGGQGLVSTPRGGGGRFSTNLDSATANSDSRNAMMSRNASTDSSHFLFTPVDVLLELNEVMIQEIDIYSGKPLLPFPQTSPLVISTVASPQHQSSGNPSILSGVGAYSPPFNQPPMALLLIGSCKIPLSPLLCLVIQLSQFVFDFVLLDETVTPPATGVAAALSRSLERSGGGGGVDPNSPLAHLHKRRCIRVLLPPRTTSADELEAFPSIVECYMGCPVRLASGQDSRWSREAESLLVGGGGICSWHRYDVNAAAHRGDQSNGGGGLVNPSAAAASHLNGSPSASPPFSPSELIPIASPTSQPQTVSATIATNVHYYGRLAANIINKGTSVAVNTIGKTGDAIVSASSPCEEPVVVPETVKSGIEGGRVIAQAAANVTGSIAAAVVNAAGYVGTVTGNAISTKIASYNTGEDDAEPTLLQTIVPPVAEVGSAVIESGALVFNAVCNAQSSVVDATKSNVARVVTHKMGPEVGQAAHGVMETARLGAEVAFVGNSKKVKRAAVLMAAKVAKQAAESAVEHHKRTEQEQLTIALRPGMGGGEGLAKATSSAAAAADGVSSPSSPSLASTPQASAPQMSLPASPPDPRSVVGEATANGRLLPGTDVLSSPPARTRTAVDNHSEGNALPPPPTFIPAAVEEIITDEDATATAVASTPICSSSCDSRTEISPAASTTAKEGIEKEEQTVVADNVVEGARGEGEEQAKCLLTASTDRPSCAASSEPEPTGGDGGSLPSVITATAATAYSAVSSYLSYPTGFLFRTTNAPTSSLPPPSSSAASPIPMAQEATLSRL